MKLRWFAVVIVVLGAAGCSPSAPGGFVKTRESRQFTILQVNDTYKIEGLENGTRGGLARLRSLRRQLESEGRPVLVLHAGDLLFPAVMSKYLKGQPMIRVLNLLDGAEADFDPLLVATFGNHEFDDRDPAVLLGRVAESDFDWVSANVYYRAAPAARGERLGERVGRVHETVVRDLGGVKVGIFGLTTDAAERDYIRYDYDDREARRAAVRHALDRLRHDGSEVIVALTHQDVAEDETLAAEFPEIDLIAGGHEHFHIARKVGRTWITKADADAQSAIVYDVRVSAAGVVEAEPHRVDIAGAIAPDAQVQAAVEGWQKRLSEQLRKARSGGEDKTIGRTAALLEGVETAVRSRETALGNFLADVIRTAMGTEIGLVNGGAIRINDNIPPGPVTAMDLEGIFYFDDKLLAFSLSGAELLEMLRNSVSKRHLGDGRFLQVSGLRFRYRNLGTADAPAFTVDAADVEVFRHGRFDRLDLSRSYTVGSTDFIWKFGYIDGYQGFAAGKGGASPPRLERPELDFRSTVERAIAELPERTITTSVDGRIAAAQR